MEGIFTLHVMEGVQLVSWKITYEHSKIDASQTLKLTNFFEKILVFWFLAEFLVPQGFAEFLFDANFLILVSWRFLGWFLGSYLGSKDYSLETKIPISWFGFLVS
ncbi:MAG: hypothetical protein EBS06_08425 [Proteobacteria bacterium]|nr:hypothetical protein [Pseudomonadota bacterium]